MKYDQIFPTLIGKTELEFDGNLINTWIQYIQKQDKTNLNQQTKV